MRLHAVTIFFALTLVGCADSTDTDSTTGGSTDPDPFLGVYDATYSGTYTVTSPPMSAQTHTGTGVITVEAGTVTDLTMSLIFMLSGGTQGNCVGTFARDGNTATFSPMQQSCVLTVNGAPQTNTFSADATVSGSTLAVHLYGSFTGKSMGVSYSGTSDGTWMGTRR